MSDKPVLTIHAGGGVKANVWLNEGNNDNGPFYNVSLIRSYKGSDDQWHETNTYRRDDLPRVEYATRKAYDFILSQQYEVGEPEQEAGSHASRVKQDRKPAGAATGKG